MVLAVTLGSVIRKDTRSERDQGKEEMNLQAEGRGTHVLREGRRGVLGMHLHAAITPDRSGSCPSKHALPSEKILMIYWFVVCLTC